MKYTIIKNLVSADTFGIIFQYIKNNKSVSEIDKLIDEELKDFKCENPSVTIHLNDLNEETLNEVICSDWLLNRDIRRTTIVHCEWETVTVWN